MTTTTDVLTIGDLEVPAGTWRIDPSHSQVGFSVRYLGLSKVRGRFEDFTGSITVGHEASDASVEATIQAASIDTGERSRDEHLRAADFLDVERYPTIEFRSTSIRPDAQHWAVEGELTLHGATRPVLLSADVEGIASDPYGNLRLAFTGKTEIDRGDFGLNWNQVLETGGVLVGRRVTIDLEIQALLDDGGDQG